VRRIRSHSARRRASIGFPGIVLLLELLQGHPLDGMLRDGALLGRLALAVVLFSIGGVVSTYARWRALDLRFGAAREE
jgi:hypothetical protein